MRSRWISSAESKTVSSRFAEAQPSQSLAHARLIGVAAAVVEAVLQAGIDVTQLPTLADLILNSPAWAGRAQRPGGPVFFKSCGWGGWDLAAARCALGPSGAGR